MPTYDYECQACGHAFERFQEMTARKLRTCPECGKRRLLRLVGAGGGVIFRGSGFYETDYKRKAPSPPAAGDGAKTETKTPSPKDGKDGGGGGDATSKGT